MGKLVRSLMVSRRPQEIFKSLQQVHVIMNPFDESATTAREMLRRVRTSAVRKANPKLQSTVDINEDYGKPSVNLKYMDGHEHVIRTEGMKIADIMDEIEIVARWKGGVPSPFERVRAMRAKALGL